MKPRTSGVEGLQVITMPKRSAIFILSVSVVFLFYYSSSSFSKNEMRQNNCLPCHKTVYEKGISAFYKHQPFEKRKCGACHLKQENIATVLDEETVRVKTAESAVLSSPDYLEKHTIFLRGLIPKAVYDISVVLRDMSGNTLRKEFKGVIPAKVQDVKTDDKKPPVISGIKVGPIKRAIFLETTIPWDTDEPSTSYVKYGISEPYWEDTPEDNTLVKHHKVTLYELAGKEYHFRAVSEDMFGNKAVSEDFVFNTATTPQVSEADETDKRIRRSSKIGCNQGIFLLDSVNSALGLHIETTKPVNMTVEYIKVEDPTVPEELQIESASALEQCPDLVTGKELTIDACYRCHTPEKLGLSHPVGVVQKQTTKVPEDLPMLEGGIITCVTCHDPHCASRPYLARREITRDVCTFCHDGY